MSRAVALTIPTPCVGATEAESLDAAIEALVAAGVDRGRIEAAVVARAMEDNAPSSCMDLFSEIPEFEHVHCREHGTCPVWDDLPLHCPGCKDTECLGWEDAS